MSEVVNAVKIENNVPGIQVCARVEEGGVLRFIVDAMHSASKDLGRAVIAKTEPMTASEVEAIRKEWESVQKIAKMVATCGLDDDDHSVEISLMAYNVCREKTLLGTTILGGRIEFEFDLVFTHRRTRKNFHKKVLFALKPEELSEVTERA